ncbi:MAG: dipeptide epimerase [Phycisphaerae bacterium]|nr:dipeptide epimerase [Saprospiraceae bacterium]
MTLSFRPILLELRHPFRLATGSRTHTNAMLTEIHFEGFVGYGEAAMPPYYGENHETAAAFLRRVAEALVKLPENLKLSGSSIQLILSETDALALGNHAAKASIDIALHDLWGKMEGRPLWQLLGVEPDKMPPTSFTLGIDEPDVLRQKMLEATDFQIIKIKLGSENDHQIIRTIREISDKPIYADANQGWTNPEAALDLVHWLAEQNVQIIEQPFPKDDLDSAAWLSARSPLPIIADESFQRVADLDRVADSFHGVNIKLMKCTGISEGFHAAKAARAKGLKLMIGCMTETSCGIMAAALLAPLCDYADIDGCWLIRNNPFEMPILEEGKIRLSNTAGLGLKLIF